LDASTLKPAALSAGSITLKTLLLFNLFFFELNFENSDLKASIIETHYLEGKCD